jgi:ATP-binding cassette, subfamily B, bacterial
MPQLSDAHTKYHAGRAAQGDNVQRDAEHRAFARAWAYLSYKASAKWLSLAAGAAHAALYIVLLLLFWFFGDLIVNQGRVPHFADLPSNRRSAFLDEWRTGKDTSLYHQWLTDVFEEGRARREHYLVSHAWLDARHQAIPIVGGGVAQIAASGARKELDPSEQELLWRIYLSEELRKRAGGAAAASVLPAYHELPLPEQQIFKDLWRAKTANGTVKKWLNDLGASSDVMQALTHDPDEFSEQQIDLAWRVNLYTAYRSDSGAVKKALGDRLRRELATDDVALEDDTLADRGILSLIVRSHLETNWQGQPVSWVLGLAVFPWFFRSSAVYLLCLFALAVIITCLRAVLGYFTHEGAAAATVEASTRLRRLVYHHTYRLGTLAIRELGPSEAVTVYTRQVEAVDDGLFTWLTVTFRVNVKIILLLLLALFLDIRLGLAFIFFALLAWAIGGQLAGYFKRRERASSHRAAEQLTLIRESLMLMRLVKIYLMELFNQARVERLLSRYRALQRKRHRGEAIYINSLVLMCGLGLLILMFVAGLVVLHDPMGNASVIALAATVVSLYLPLVRRRESVRVLRRADEAALAVFRFLDRPADVRADASAEFLQPLQRSLEFDDVSLREPGTNRLLLQHLTLKMAAGERVGIIGVEDNEKHALVYLIPRFLDPSAGEIRIDDHNLRFVTLDSLRVQIALVVQHNLVFHDSVKNNISCGDKAYTQPQIIEAAKLAHAHNFIQKLPQGYETPIGELGHSLSVNQQFRIALARAILRDPAIIVIEEPAIALDDDTKALIDDTYARVLPGRTVIFLPHRISTIRSCDRLFMLHRGQLEASGSHRELLAKSPLYRHLHYIEFNEIAESA